MHVDRFLIPWRAEGSEGLQMVGDSGVKDNHNLGDKAASSLPT